MKKISLLLVLALALSLLAGCAGTPVVYYSDCTCPTGSHATKPPVTAEGALKTGLYIAASAADSVSAGEKDGEVKYDVTYAAVLVDDQGVIQDCIIDSVGTSVTFSTAGTITSDLNAILITKNEWGSSYGMVAYGNAIAEWNEQAAALANFAIGKTVEELKNGAVDETGYAPDGSDLRSSATIYLAGYVAAIEAAVASAQHLGAQAGDTLKLAVISNLRDSKDGTAQLDSNVTALTVSSGTVTSCVIDSLQGKVEFDRSGALTTDVSAPLRSKNQLGEEYGMKAWGKAIAEWNEQAASYAAYITGKDRDQILNIAMSHEDGKPTEEDLRTSVTISIADFRQLIVKALDQ